MRNPVGRIGFRRVPPKILEGIILLVAIIVTCLAPLWTRANKSFEYNVMQILEYNSPCFSRKSRHNVPSLCQRGESLNEDAILLLLAAPERAIATRFVARKTRDRSPLYFCLVPFHLVTRLLVWSAQPY